MPESSIPGAAGKALSFHEETSHDRWSLGGHGLDWANQPSVFKRYPAELGLSAHPLKEPADFPDVGLFQAIQGRGAEGRTPDEAALSRVLAQACGITSVSRSPRGDFYYRSAPSAGALYPVEIYCALGAPLDIETGPALGLHHYAPLEHGLTALGRQDAAHHVAAACPGMDRAPGLSFVLTSIFFRSTWKYRARGYRYCLLDCGHVLENLLLALAAEGLRAKVHVDFDDTALNALLGLDTALEAALAVVEVQGWSADAPPEVQMPYEAPEFAELAPSSRVAAEEQHYQQLAAMHQAGVQLPPAGVSAESPGWHEIADATVHFDPLPEEFSLNAVAENRRASLSEILAARKSRRNFMPQRLEEDAMAALVRSLCAMVQGEPEGKRICEIALSLQNIAGGAFHDGVHLLRPGDCSLARLIPGNMQEALATICLGQEWLKNAAAHVLLFADLGRLGEELGPRAYRHALLEAGRLGERVYLAATALGLGACGIGAYFDMEAAALLGLEHKAQLLYMVACGPVRR